MGGSSTSSSGSTGVLSLELDPKLRSELAREARRRKKPAADLVRDLIERYLEDVEDYRAALEAEKRDRGESTIPLPEVKRRLGLED